MKRLLPLLLLLGCATVRTELTAWRVMDSTGRASSASTLRENALTALLARRDDLSAGQCAWLEVTKDTGRTWAPETKAGCLDAPEPKR